MRRIGLVAVIALVLPLTGCAAATTAGSAAPVVTAASQASSSIPSSTRTATPTATPTASRPTAPTPTAPTPTLSGTTVMTDGSQFGEILFDGTGQAIYLFDLETTTEPACYGDCATAWPPVLTDGAPVAGGSVRADALGTTTRSDGSEQVTYSGHPLYFYADEGKNEVTCHDVVEFGGRWLVVTPTGDAAEH